MKEFHSFGWYAAKIAPLLPKEYLKPVPSRLWGGFAYLIVVIMGILMISITDLHPIINIVVSVILGTSFASLGFLGHEILHGTIVRKAWIRDLLGAIAFWPLSTGPNLWRKWHNMNHHVHTQDDHKDPDAWPNIEQVVDKPFLKWIYKIPFPIRACASFLSLAVQFSVHSTMMFMLYIKEFKPKKKPAVWIQLILPWATWIGLLFVIGPLKWLFAFLLPLLIANLIVMGYISTNHRLNPLVPVNDPLANSLTVTVPKWVDVLHFNFSYHTEHHLFPAMSPKYYPIVKEHIKKMWPDRYHEMPHFKALIALWKTPRVYDQNTELVDPRLGNAYGSLGNGLDPENIQSRQVRKKEEKKK
ncbi:acyl-CoA desaturase [Bacillus sp. 03113]|uniref:fatty acid desaturase family protein n=1 Tax=Bacillus sp. 03113 TaxID=2578211 RepID=UPI00114474BF|nr:acyl-CoA desaturase [Bacillus sp. 03113]